MDDKKSNYSSIHFKQSGLSFDEKLLCNDQNICYLFKNYGKN